MLGTILFFNEPFTNIVTITFSALIVIELLNVYTPQLDLRLTNINVMTIAGFSIFQSKEKVHQTNDTPPNLALSTHLEQHVVGRATVVIQRQDHRSLQLQKNLAGADTLSL